MNKRILTATILHKGWEMDNEAWIEEVSPGVLKAFTTNHGACCLWTRKEAEEKLKETEESAAAIRKALELWPEA